MQGFSSLLFPVFCVTEISLNVFLFPAKLSGDDILSEIMSLCQYLRDETLEKYETLSTSVRTLNVLQQIKTI